MRKKIHIHYLVLTAVLLILITSSVYSQMYTFEENERKEQKVWGSYFVTGTFGALYLFDDVQGDQNLFLSQFNLKDGFNVGQISFQATRDPSKKGFLDVISLNVAGFGAEPYGRASFMLKKRNAFSLSGGYTERKHFSDVASFTNPLFEAESDDILFRSFHTWNSKEKSFDLNGTLRAASWLSFDAFWQNTKIEGDSTTTFRLLNNEFPLNEPLNQVNNAAGLSTDISIGNIVFYKIAGIYNKYELDQTASSTGMNVGIRGLPYDTSSIFLTDHYRQTFAEIKTWILNQSLQIFPLDWLTIQGSYAKTWTEGMTSGSESFQGRFIWPFYDFADNASYTNSGELKKDFDKGNVTFSFKILPQLRIRAGYDHYKYLIENSDESEYSFHRIYYDRTVTGSSMSDPLLQVQSDRYFGDFTFDIGRYLSASGGYSHSKSNLDYQHDGMDEKESYSYKLNSYYASLSARISDEFSVESSIEKGDYNRVFARLIPLEATKITFKGKFNLKQGFSGSLFYKYQQLENTDFSYDSSLNGFGGHLNYLHSNGNCGGSLHISKNDFDSTMNIIRYVSLFTEIEDISKYSSDTVHYSVNFWLRKGRVRFNGGYNYTKTDGTFPIKMEFPYASLAFNVVSDFAILFHYRYYNHEQENFLSQNYKAHLFNVGFQYNF